MNAREMTTQEHTQMALEFLAASDREFAAGERLQASEKLYGAATHIVTAIAQQRDWQYRSHRAMKNAIFRLEQEYNDPLILAGFLAAEDFHKNFFHNDMEEYEIEQERPVVHRFVSRMLALLDDSDRAGARTEQAVRHHDLDDLAGTWVDDPAFDQAIEAMDRID